MRLKRRRLRQVTLLGTQVSTMIAHFLGHTYHVTCCHSRGDRILQVHPKPGANAESFHLKLGIPLIASRPRGAAVALLTPRRQF